MARAPSAGVRAKCSRGRLPRLRRLPTRGAVRGARGDVGRVSAARKDQALHLARAQTGESVPHTARLHQHSINTAGGVAQTLLSVLVKLGTHEEITHALTCAKKGGREPSPFVE